MEGLLRELFIIALLSCVVTLFCSKLRIPAIIGFLLSGVLLGPNALKLVSNAELVNNLAEIGIVFLLFSIGLQFSGEELLSLRKQVFVGGTLQVAVTIFVFALISYLAVPQFGFGNAIFFGFLIALSSTAIVLKIFEEMGQMEAPPGRISFAILIFQDLAIVPMMLLIPVLAGTKGVALFSPNLLFTAGKTLLIITVFFFLAKKFIPSIILFIVSSKSKEVFLVSILGICLGTAYITSNLGLSVSLGAFIAGVIVAESEYSANALEEILPFRDVFTSIFFISVGMLLDATFFLQNVGIICLVVLLVFVGKGIIAYGVVRVLKYPLRPAIIVAFSLCQVGEFSFVLAKNGFSEKLLDFEQYQYFLAASIITMGATPFLMKLSPKIANFLSDKKIDIEEQKEVHSLSEHLIIIGFGISGRLLSKAAKNAEIPYVVMEMNPETVHAYAKKGEPICYGDATHSEGLRSLGIERARALSIVISDPAASRHIIEIARKLNPSLYIIARTRFVTEVEALKSLGATEVIPEEFETAIEIFTRVLHSYFVPKLFIEEFTAAVREGNYKSLRSDSSPEYIMSLHQQLSNLTVTTFIVHANAPLDGVLFKDANLRQEANITVIAVRRDGILYPHPGGDFKLEPKDIVYTFSSPKDAVKAAKLFTN